MRTRKPRKTAGFIFIFTGFFLLLINLFLSGCITTLQTPEIKGVVLDAETEQPIKDARVYAEWRKVYSGPGGRFEGGVIKSLRLVTKEDGVFEIPDYLLINYIPYPFGQEGVFYVLFYAHGYEDKDFTFFENRELEKPKYDELKTKEKVKKIKLKKIEDDEKYYFQTGKDLRLKGKNYYIDDSRFFLRKFPHSRWCSTVQYYIADMYKNIKDYDNAIKEYEIMIEKYPQDGLVFYAKKNIEQIKQKMKEGSK